ncbi:MAG: SURF1 family protein [Pseudolabrys sp.]|nr:SURF1 family protein [Pseudolabrys sp.]
MPSEMRRRGIVVPTLFALAAISLLIGFGKWQMDRKVWKEDLILSLNTRLAGPPKDLAPRADWPRLVQDRDEFTRVTFPAEFIEGEEALVYTAGSPLRPDVKGPGYWVLSPARLAGGSVVIINRGFVPVDRKDASTRSLGAPRGIVDVTGVMRWTEPRGTFTPADDVTGNLWYVRDPKAISDAKKWASAAPFYIDQEAPVPPGGLPLPGKLEVNLPNNHLQYVVTWFGLALALAGVYLVWLVGRLRRR